MNGPDDVMLLRRDDVEHALKQRQDFSSDFGGIMGSDEPIIPLNVDPPLHVKYRRLLDPYFAPKKMAALQPPCSSTPTTSSTRSSTGGAATSPRRSRCRCRARPS